MSSISEETLRIISETIRVEIREEINIRKNFAEKENAVYNETEEIIDKVLAEGDGTIMAQKEIRFIDSRYNELFRIPDGGKIEITHSDGETVIKECTYVDDYHTKVGNYLFHICEFAETMERNGSTYKAVEAPMCYDAHEHLKHKNGLVILNHLGSTDKDKFFLTENGATEMYYNPDSTAGGQIVINEISKELIQESAKYNKDADDFFAFLDGGCKQYLIDIDTPEFKSTFLEFVNKKADFEGINDKTMKGLKKHAGIDKKKSEPER